ncbi:zinc finger protein [Macleaya cordata]|uniref:Zinc finger protein n=1 Tax=Macleaya cordata TaxID=56857 RepID=A0A200QDI2_MACCD|nr:zinc finger protein [Macleaya cordata]
MESVASNSPPPNHRLHHRFTPTQPVADRIVRALRHRLRLLYRSNANFFILGATGNVYTVTLTTTPSCNCPDRTIPCKHILFVFLRVLGISIDDPCLRRRTLRSCQLTRLLNTPMSPQTLAGERARERFHHLFSQSAVGPPPRIELGDGATCPICLDEMDNENKIVECGTCRNALHKQCLITWKRSRGRSANCVICRARWRERAEQDRYLNLAAYVSEDEMVNGGALCGD